MMSACNSKYAEALLVAYVDLNCVRRALTES
jgi:hypothetical protein